MADFQNTIDIVGDAVAARMIVDRTIEEYNDDVMTSVGEYAFYNCSALTSVYIPRITSIANFVFYNCSNLESVYLPATPPNIKNVNAFSRIKSDCKFYIPTGSLGAYQSATNWSSLTSTYSFIEEER